MWTVFTFFCLPSSAQFTESFESGSLPGGWQVINVSAGTSLTWNVVSASLGNAAHQGSKMMNIEGNFFSSSPAHDDYLITPAITVQAGVNDYISFYAKNGTDMHYADVITLKVSTTGKEAGDFTDILAGNIKAPTSWTKYGYDLTDYIGETIYIAFYNNTYDGGKGMYLDYVVSGAIPPPLSGCTESPEGQYPTSSFDARTCTGKFMEIADDAYAGEYSVVRLKGGETYTFRSSIGTDYLTIATNNSSKTLLAHGTTPVTYTPQSNENIRFYNHTGASCGSEKKFRTRSVSCGSPPPASTNDEARGALKIAVGAQCSGNKYDMSEATAAPDEPFPGCGMREDTGEKTLWFKFSAPASGTVKITTDFVGATLDDPRMALYSATDSTDYSTFTNLACDDDGGVTDGDWKSVIFYAGLTPGQTYYVQVEEYQDYYDGAFCLEIHEINAEMLSTNSSCTENENTVFGHTEYNGWISLTDDEGGLIALVKHSGGVASSSTSELVNIHTGPIRRDGKGTSYLDRNFTLINENPGPYEVILFFLKTELDALAAADPSVSIASLGVSRQAEADCAADFSSDAGIISGLTVIGSGLTSEVGWVKFSTPSFSNFFINGSDQVLPVNWADFTVTLFEGKVLLKWVTASEKNNLGFSIERSTDARHFEKIGWKDGAGDSREKQIYTFDDAAAIPGKTYYYRLHQVDFDGKTSSSPLKSIRLPNGNIRISPNPAHGKFTLDLPDKTSGQADITLLDLQGKPVRQWTKEVKSDESLALDTGNLHTGFYLVHVRVSGLLYIQKLLIQ